MFACTMYIEMSSLRHFDFHTENALYFILHDLHVKIEFQYLPLKRCVKLNRTQSASLIVRVALFQHFSTENCSFNVVVSVYFASNRIFSCKQIAMFELG